MNYFELYPGDYLRDTTRLSLVEHGAYLRLLMAYYAEEQPLPASLNELYTAAGATSSAGKKAVKKVAEKYFPEGPDGMRHNARADAEIAKAADRMEGSVEKRASDLERQRRTRERRSALFSELRAVGIVPDALIPMAELRALHEQHVTRDTTVTDGVTSGVTKPKCHAVNTVTRSQTPYTNQEQELLSHALLPNVARQPSPSARASESTPEDSQLPAGVDPERWASYRDQLADDGKLSISRIKTALMQLRRVSQAGHDPNAVLTAAVMRGLRDLDDCALRLAREKGTPTARAGPGGHVPAQSRTLQAIEKLQQVAEDAKQSRERNRERLDVGSDHERLEQVALPEPRRPAVG